VRRVDHLDREFVFLGQCEKAARQRENLFNQRRRRAVPLQIEEARPPSGFAQISEKSSPIGLESPEVEDG